MTKVIGIRRPWAITVRKKFGRAVYEENGSIYGTNSYGVHEYGRGESKPETEYHGVYQMRRCKEGYIPVQMRFYKPTNPRTALQQSNRDKIRAGVIAWQALTNEQKLVYNKSAQGQQLTGYNLFIKNFLLSH